MPRYDRYRIRIFLKRYNRIIQKMGDDRHAPRTLKECFERLKFNSDATVDYAADLIDECYTNPKGWVEVAWLFISIGYVLGRRAKKYKKPKIKRFPRL